MVPEAKAAMDQFKMQAASEVGVNLQNGYNGDLTARQAGSIGGQMVNKIEHSFIIEKISENRWEMCRDQYISFAKNLENRNDSNKKTAHKHNIEKVLSALGEKSLFSLDAVASLGFTKAQSQQIISDLLKEKYISKETAGRYRWIK